MLDTDECAWDMTPMDLALRTLGFESHSEYQRLVSKVADKTVEAFKLWESTDGTKEKLIELINPALL